MGQIQAAGRSAASIVLWTIFVFAVLTGISLGGLYWSGWFSTQSGKVGVQIQNNDANNRITAASNFSKLYNEIQGYELQIRSTVDPADANLRALSQECELAVGQYNSMLQDPTTKDWVPQGDPTDPIPMTACEKE
jgi:hypothetical protein